MSPLKYLCFSKVLLLFLCFIILFISFSSCGASDEVQQQGTQPLRVRRLLVKDLDDDDNNEKALPPPPKKKKLTDSSSTPSSTSTKKNQTKLIKPTSSSSSTKNQTKLTTPTSSTSKNQTKLTKPISSSSSTKNQTKLTKPISSSTKNQTKLTKPTSDLKKLNSTTKSTNSTKPISSTTKKSPDLTKPTSKPKLSPPITKPNTKPKPKPIEKEIKPFWLDDEEDEDFVNEFKSLPTKFQRSLIPDLEKISTQSKSYLTKANKEITRNFKPYFGSKYSPTIASIVSFIFLLVPLLLVSLIFNKFKSYFSLQKLLIFIQIYLSIYFTILCISSIVTGIEPLKFLYATSSVSYVCLQILQTLGYVLYLLILLMYLVLVFSTDCGLGLKVLGLAQTFVGFAVGLHYYVAVFHRVVLRQPPKTNWKVHGVYATCFLLICLLSSAERRKKTYLEESGDEGKKN